MKPIHISNDVLHTQSRGCWLCVHFRYTAIYFRGWWRRWQGIRIELNAPLRSQDKRDIATEDNPYPLGRYSFRISRFEP